MGVLISVTTIPAAAGAALAAAYGNGADAAAGIALLLLNLVAIFLAGIATLFVQRRIYVVRRRRHLSDPARREAGLPIGKSRHAEKGHRPDLPT